MATGFYATQGPGAFVLKFEGLDEIERKLKAMPDKVAKKVVRKSLMAGANVIAKEASRLAPSGRRSLSDLKMKKETLKQMVRKVDKTSVHSMTINVGPTKDAWYAHFVEFGTAKHWIPKFRKKVMKGAIRAVTGMVGKTRRGAIYIPKYGQWFTQVEHPGARKKPFLRPAFDSKGIEAVNKTRDIALKEIEKIAGEAA